MVRTDAAAAAIENFRGEYPLIETIELILPDLGGVLRGKRIALAEFEAAMAGKTFFTSSLYALDTTGANVDRSGLVWEEGDADRPLLLDPATLRPVPWREEFGQVIGGLADHDGSPFFANPRSVLEGVVARFDALGLVPVVAIELEFYVVDEALREDGSPKLGFVPRLGGAPQETEVYLHERLIDQDALLRLIDEYCRAQGLPNKGAVAEFAPGQFEINLGHREDALLAADEAVMLKRVIKAAAANTGQRATFMAKPFAGQAGSGLHIHVSLVDSTGANAFAGGPEARARLEASIAGLQRLMAPSMLIFAPNANSYRRLRPMSYAPMAPTWGFNNRTVALRVPAGGAEATRIEHRVAGADANPYLALAAVLAGILDGLDHGGDPGPPIKGNGYTQSRPTLPASWEQALTGFDAGGALSAHLGKPVVDLYRSCRQAELDRFMDKITQTEFTWYLSAV